MKNYKSTEEKFVFSPRMEAVHRDILKRLKPNRQREDTKTSPVSAGGQDPFRDVFCEMADEPYVIKEATAIVRSWLVTPVVIFENEPLVGITRPDYPNMEHFHWGIMTEGLQREIDGAQGAEKASLEALRQQMEPLGWKHLTQEAAALLGTPRWHGLSREFIFSAGGYQGHTIPSYPRLLEYGLDGMLGYIDECAAKNGGEPADLYEACRIIIRGMSAWLEGYGQKAAQLADAEEEENRKRWYRDIAENCAFVAHRKPETLYQAAQLTWTLSLWDWVDCVGRMDQYLYPFYLTSKTEGDVISAEEVVTSLVFKIWENGVHNLTLGGVKPEDGSDATNELSYLLLQVLRSIHDTHPRMSLRIHDGMEPEILDLAIKMWQEGMSDPTVVGDDTVIRGLTQIGIPLADARDYSELGCQEIEIPGKSNFGCEDGVFNLAKILEFTLYNGRSRQSPDMQVGLPTGEFTEFGDFEAFYTAYYQQLSYFTDIFIKLCNKGQEIRAANFSKLVKTPFTEGCLEKGKNHDAGGPLYNYGVVETGGLAVVADSLTAIKKLVFDQKKIDKSELIRALDANFAGYEELRQMLLRHAPKFGNDDPEADEMACRVLEDFWNLIGRYKSVRGDVFTGACSLLEGGIAMGANTGALPDGRFAGEPFGNTMGPRPGADREGITAMLNSVSKLPLEKGVGGTTLNLVLTSKLLESGEMRGNVASLIHTFLKNGGQMIQVTTANVEDLKDAVHHPENHGDLIVRIGGFSIQFVQLGPEAQQEVISRYQSAC
ncbi:MAG: hypothetical protein IKU11_05395 [Clostridia bacterium]|nr:hypothetical protein [Clostridia bacterium]